MVARARLAASAFGEAAGIAFGWALLTGWICLVLFADMTGGGSVWSALCGLGEHASRSVSWPSALRRVTVAARASDNHPFEDRELVVSDEPSIVRTVSAGVPAPDAYAVRP